MPFSSVFACYSGLILCGFEIDKAHIWRVAIMEFIFFVLGSFVADACHFVFMSKTANLRIVTDDIRGLVPMPDRLAYWVSDLSYFPIVCNSWSDSVLTHVVIPPGLWVGWSCLDLKDPFFLYLWHTREVISSADKCMHDRKRETNHRVLYHER